MALLLNADFDTDTEGFDAGTRVAAEGVDFATGYFSVGPGVTATKSFTAISSGIFRCDLWLRVDDAETSADNTKDTFVYLLPTAGTPVSTNAIAVIHICRNTANATYTGVTATGYGLGYHNGTAFVVIPQASPARRGAHWVKLSFVGSFAAKTYSLYINDVLWAKALAWPNLTAADFSRVVVLARAAAPATLFDNIRVESDWVLPTESVLIDHDFTTGATGEIETLTPTTDARNINAQPWKILDNTTTYGAFTVGANGAQADVGKASTALVRCRPEGIIECEFKTSNGGGADDLHMGLWFRVWAGPGNAAHLWLRYWSGGGSNLWQLFHDTTSLQTASSPTLAGNTIYTLKVETRGRYIDCYYKTAAMDAGSYTLIFSHQITSASTGANGQLSEENAGPHVDSAISGVTDNYVRRFRFTGLVPSDEKNVTVGDLTYNLGYGSIREAYHALAGSPTRNLGWSKHLQFGHVSGADMGNYATAQQTIYDATHVKVYRQRALNISALLLYGVSESYVTLLRRGVWMSDRTTVFVTTNNIGPDMDLRGELWDLGYRIVGSTGAGSPLTHSGFHDWRTDLGLSALPHAHQHLTVFGSGSQVRLTQVKRNNLNLSDSLQVSQTKYVGHGDPMSHATSRQAGNVVADTPYEFGRAFLYEIASALSDTVLTSFRDDVKTPATLTAGVGSLKTDAAGDIDVDGFNERFGWYEWACSGGLGTFTMPVPSGTRYGPAFRLNSWTNTNTQVTINGVLGVAGTDYVLDDLGGSVGLLQLLSNRTANTTVAVEAPVAVGGSVSRFPLINGGLIGSGLVTGGLIAA